MLNYGHEIWLWISVFLIFDVTILVLWAVNYTITRLVFTWRKVFMAREKREEMCACNQLIRAWANPSHWWSTSPGMLPRTSPKASSLSQLRNLHHSPTKVTRRCHGGTPHKGPMEGRIRLSYMLKMIYPPPRSLTCLARAAWPVSGGSLWHPSHRCGTRTRRERRRRAWKRASRPTQSNKPWTQRLCYSLIIGGGKVYLMLYIIVYEQRLQQGHHHLCHIVFDWQHRFF